MIKMRRKIRPVLMYVALFLVMFGIGFAVAKTTETTSALDQRTLLEFSQNNILFYNPDERNINNKCVSTVHYDGNELTWDDLSPLGPHDRLKLIMETYGPFAMDLQRWYGVPWEMPFGVMVNETFVGESSDPNGPNMKARSQGMFEMMGLVDDNWLNNYGALPDHFADSVQSLSVCSEIDGSCGYPEGTPQTQAHSYKNYRTISQMMLGYVIHHVRSDHGVPTELNGTMFGSPYSAGLSLLDYQHYSENLREAIGLMMSPYCSRSDGQDCYNDKLYNLIIGANPEWPEFREVTESKGWMTSAQLAEAEQLPAGGYVTAPQPEGEGWGWSDIRQNVLDTYGEAGLPSSEATRYGATTTTTQNGSVTAEVGGDSVLHSPTHEWLEDVDLGIYHMDAVSTTGPKVDINAVENGAYANYASDSGNGSGLPGFIILHLSSASNFGARSWTNYCGGYEGGYCPPHFTIDVKQREVFQHFPLSHPSAAVSDRLDTPDGSTFYSDKYGIQIEIVGHGGTPDQTCMPESCDVDHLYTNFTDEDWEYVAKLLVAISDETGIPLTSTVPWANDYSQAAGMILSTDDLKSYIGVLGHEHINGKWDPLDAWYYIESALQRIDYRYNSTSSSISTCGVARLSGRCFSLNSDADGGCTEDGFTYYLQGGPSWGSIPYLNNDGSTCYDGGVDGNNTPLVGTIGTSGCAPAAMAMIITALTDSMVTPSEVAEVSSSVGGRACGAGSYGGAMPGIAERYGLKAEYISDPSVGEVENWLNRGAMIILSVGGEYATSQYGTIASPGYGHFIAIRGISSDGKWYSFDSSAAKQAGDNGKPRSDRKYEPSDIINAYESHAASSGGNMYAIYK